MKPITVKKDALLGILRTNRDAHHDIFVEAVEGFRAEATRLLEEEIDRIRRGKMAEVHVMLPAPSDHTRDYDRLIGLLEMGEQDEVDLTEQEYGMYVLDDWGWKGQFLTANSTYSQTAASQLQRI